MDLKVWILAISMIVSNAVTIFLYLKNRQLTLDTFLNEKLFKLQDIALNHPLLSSEQLPFHKASYKPPSSVFLRITRSVALVTAKVKCAKSHC